MANTILQQSLTTTILVTDTGKPIIKVFAGGASGAPKQPRVITENYTIERSDVDRWILSDSNSPISIFFPDGIPLGAIEIFQRGSGQITVVPIGTATFVNTELRSAGQDAEQKKMTLYSYGNDTAMLYGDTVEGIAEWSIIGNETVTEGDMVNYVIWRPDSTNEEDSFTIQVTGTGFDDSGFTQTLEEALTQLATLESHVEFDGTDTLTISPDARNPLPITFHVRPTHTAVGDRDVTIAISNPSIGDLSLSAASVTTAIENISRPFDPMDWFTTSVQTLSVGALSGATTLTLNDILDVDRYSHLSGTGIAAGTYVTAISGNTITLNNAITTNLSIGASISVKRGGAYFDFSDTSTITKDGSDIVSSVTDKVNGYAISQATSTRRPTYSATAISGAGGITFDGTSDVLSSTTAALAKLLDHARAEFTIFVIGKLNSFSSTARWMDGPKGIEAHVTGGLVSVSQSNGLKEIQSSAMLGIPFVSSIKSDGSAWQVKLNGTRVYIPVTLTADAASGQKDLLVDDISSIQAGLFARVTKTKGIRATESTNVGVVTSSEPSVTSTTDSPKTVTMSQNLVEQMRSGQELQFFSNIPTNQSPVVAKTTTTLSVGAGTATSLFVGGSIGAILIVPRQIAYQVEMGIFKYFSNRYASSFTTTAAAGAVEGATKLTLASTTNVRLYQIVTGAGLPANAVVSKINTTTNEIWIDEPVLEAGVSNGATLTFTNAGFKAPTLLDIEEFDLYYHDGFETGAMLSNAGEGWKDYYGEITSPGTYATAYGALGHGSSNNLSTEYQWYLDRHNYAPWRQYPTLLNFADSDVPKGGIKINCIPTPPEIADQIGYFPPEPDTFKYISHYLRWAGARYVQYGYWESRMKMNKIVGCWPAFWITAANGQWPPEVDIAEQYGKQPGITQSTIHMSRNFTSNLFQNRAFNNVGDMIDNMGDKYITFGVEVHPDHITFYINREKTVSYMPNWDHHTPYIVQLNMSAIKQQVLNLIDEMPMWVDYVAVWKRKSPVVTLTGTEQAETTALLAAMTTQPTAGRKTLINAVIEEMKLTSASLGGTLWDRCDSFGCGEAETAQASRIDWKDPTRIGTVVGTPTFTANRGYVGVLNTSYIDMGYVLKDEAGYDLNSTLNQSHIGVVTDAVTNTTSIPVGTSTSFNIMPKSNSTLTGSLWGTSRTGNIASTTGHFIMSRNHFHYVFYQNGNLASGKPTSGDNTHTTDSGNLRLANGTTRCNWWHMGDYITPDDAEKIYAIIRKYRLAIGSTT